MIHRHACWSVVCVASFALACSGEETQSNGSLASTGGIPIGGAGLGGGGTDTGGVSSAGGTGTAGLPAAGGQAGQTGAGGAAGGQAGQSGTGGGQGGTIGAGGVAGAPTVTCAQAAAAYTVARVELAASLVPHAPTSGSRVSLHAQVPVAVNAATGEAFVGFMDDASLSSMIVPAVAGASAPVVTVPNAALGGIAVTSNGFAALTFDPNDDVNARMWAAVARFDGSGTELFRTELFHSPNLTDTDTKGAPGTSRFGYVAASNELVPYFGHTEMTQGVRHQGGYLARVDQAGVQTVVSGWWGSHNLDQRLLVSDQVAMLGLGDAYPKGIFFSFLTNRPQTRVIYTLAGNGQGRTNGQLGGMVDLTDAVAVPFITNDSISQTLTPGDWPNIDQTIAGQIAAAADNGNKLGMLFVPKTGTLPSGDLTPVWVEPSLTAGARLERLKSARYGTADLVLLAWAEATGTGRTVTRTYFTMIVDRNGAICQPKTPLPAEQAFTAGDDMVMGPSGQVVWANVTNGRIGVVTLTPG